MKATKSIGIYILRGITLLIAVAIISFILAQVSPVDPVRQYIQANPGVSEENIEAMKEYWGLNDPPVERFVKWFSAVLHGDWGYSTTFRQPVLQVIGIRFRTSLALMITAWLFSGILGFVIGCVMALFRERARPHNQAYMSYNVLYSDLLDRAYVPCGVFLDARVVPIRSRGSGRRTRGGRYAGSAHTPPYSARAHTELSVLCKPRPAHQREAC